MMVLFTTLSLPHRVLVSFFVLFVIFSTTSFLFRRNGGFSSALVGATPYVDTQGGQQRQPQATESIGGGNDSGMHMHDDDDSESDDDSDDIIEDDTSGEQDPELIQQQQRTHSQEQQQQLEILDAAATQVGDRTVLVTSVVTSSTASPATTSTTRRPSPYGVDDAGRMSPPNLDAGGAALDGDLTDPDTLDNDEDKVMTDDELMNNNGINNNNGMTTNSLDLSNLNSPMSSTYVMVTYQSSRSKLIAIISKPGIMAGIIGGAVIGLLTAMLLIMFIVYRMRKKDEGSYALEETKKPLNAYDYRHCPTKEFYA